MSRYSFYQVYKVLENVRPMVNLVAFSPAVLFKERTRVTHAVLVAGTLQVLLIPINGVVEMLIISDILSVPLLSWHSLLPEWRVNSDSNHISDVSHTWFELSMSDFRFLQPELYIVASGNILWVHTNFPTLGWATTLERIQNRLTLHGNYNLASTLHLSLAFHFTTSCQPTANVSSHNLPISTTHQHPLEQWKSRHRAFIQ